ncbi:MAG: metal ABC transporter permease [Verrucomicrobia bacterium]|nr:metal ABC transporter permease [Verrucomicrobiota bacterium]
MDWLFEPFQHTFMQRALVACVLIGFLNGFIGGFVMLRRMALMADSLSHSLLPGLAVGVLLFGLAPMGLFFGALSAALAVALGAQLLARGARVKEDSALAILYTAAFSSGVVLLSFVKVRVSLMHYLFGNILGVSNQDLWLAYGVALVVLPLLVAVERPLQLLLFDAAVARSQGVPVALLNTGLVVALVLTMLSSLQAVGVILLLGLLIAPAATVYLLCDSFPMLLWGGGVLGVFGSVLGLWLSYWLGVPSGACIVLVLGALFCLAYLFSPRYGLISKLWKARHFHQESLARWENHK